jgi:hypothetical protein
LGQFEEGVAGAASRARDWRGSSIHRPGLFPELAGTQMYRFPPMISGAGTLLGAIARSLDDAAPNGACAGVVTRAAVGALLKAVDWLDGAR